MDHLSLIIFYLNTFKGCKPMYNLLFKKEKKYTHLYQNGEKSNNYSKTFFEHKIL